MKTATPDNPHSSIKDEIRVEAARACAAQGEVQHRATAPIAPARLIPYRDNYTIRELSAAQYTDFLNLAYQALLRRGPDEAGYCWQIRQLEEGRSKIEVLGNLRFSTEGRAIDVQVPGLWPRYLLAKATAIPVLGYAIEWLMCLGGLPRILRHQRAADAYHAARNTELKSTFADEVAAKARLAEAIEHLKTLQAQSAIQQNQANARIEECFKPLHAQQEQASSEIRDLRHLVMSANHWLATLRQNLAALEQAENEQLRRNEGWNVEVSRRILVADKSRSARIKAWAKLFASGLPAPAEVLDIGSGLDWQQSLIGHNVKLSGIDANIEIGQQARETGIPLANADPADVLARLADDALDGVSILDLAPLLRSLPALALLETLRRVLRPGGQVLVGFCEEHGSIIDRLEGRPDIAVDADLIEQALHVSGFVDIKRHSASEGRQCLVATQPQPQ